MVTPIINRLHNARGIANGTTGTATLLIYEPIGGDDLFGDIGGVTAKSVATWLESLDRPSDLEIRINSPGGDVFSGLAIYNRLAAYPVQKTVYVDGMAWSIASVIAMAGDRIVMASNAQMMIHDPAAWLFAGAEELRKVADQLDEIKLSLIDAYQRHSNANKRDLSAWMQAETWFNADDAVSAGLATEVERAPMPMVACAPAFLLSCFKRMPQWVPVQPLACARPQLEQRAARYAALVKNRFMEVAAQ